MLSYQKSNRRKRWRYTPVVLLIFGVVCIIRMFYSEGSLDDPSTSTVFHTRHLSSLDTASDGNETKKCLPQAITNFPRDLFTNDQRRHGLLLLHIIAALYMFYGLALVCDEFFVPSLECICEFLKLKPDVAGATFMAAGSSAPELATTVIGVFIAKDDIALGAVVGSADYNLMFVISVCALFAKSVIYLNWWPLVRDCVVYTISVIMLALVIFDEKVYWYESFSFLVVYLLYVFFMWFNSRAEDFFVEKCAGCLPLPKNSPNNKYLLRDNNNDRDLELSVPLTTTINGSCLEEIALEEGDELPASNGAYRQIPSEKLHGSQEALNPSENGLTISENHGTPSSEEWVISWPSESNCFFKTLHLIGLPLKVLLFFTVPDCRHKRFRRLYWLTFIMSCVWISLYSYVMVWMITVIGHTIKIPDTVMGLTFIAAGSSVPDAIASVIVVREGEGDMAVSNAVGSNIFDILICMGCPWLLKSLLFGAPVIVYSGGLLYATLTLLATVVLLLGATHLNGWKLSRKYGVFLMVIYVLYLILCSLYELNVFGVVHPPPCPFHD